MEVKVSRQESPKKMLDKYILRCIMVYINEKEVKP